MVGISDISPYIATAEGGTVRIYDTNDNSIYRIESINGSVVRINSVVFLIKIKIIAVLLSNRKLIVYDIETNSMLYSGYIENKFTGLSRSYYEKKKLSVFEDKERERVYFKTAGDNEESGIGICVDTKYWKKVADIDNSCFIIKLLTN